VLEKVMHIYYDLANEEALSIQDASDFPYNMSYLEFTVQGLNHQWIRKYEIRA